MFNPWRSNGRHSGTAGNALHCGVYGPRNALFPLWPYDMLHGHAEFSLSRRTADFTSTLCSVNVCRKSKYNYRLNNGIPFEMAAQPPFSLFDITNFIETQDIQQFARSMTLPRPLDPWLSMWWTSQSAVDWDRGGWQLGTSQRRLAKPLCLLNDMDVFWQPV